MNSLNEIIPDANNFKQLSNYSRLPDDRSSCFLTNDKVWVFGQNCKFCYLLYIINNIW